jgi:hypothetical protein
MMGFLLYDTGRRLFRVARQISTDGNVASSIVGQSQVVRSMYEN